MSTQERNPFQLTHNDIISALSASNNLSQFGPSDFDILSAHQRSNQFSTLSERRNFNVIPGAERLSATSRERNISSSSALEAYQRYEPAVQTPINSSDWKDYTKYENLPTTIQKSVNQIHDIDSNDATATPYNLNLKTVEEEDEFLYGDSNSFPETPKCTVEDSITTNLRTLDTGWSDDEDPYNESSDIKLNSEFKNTTSVWDTRNKSEVVRESQSASLTKGPGRQLRSPALGPEVSSPKKVIGQTAKLLVSDKNPVISVESRSKYHAAAEILKKQSLENKRISKSSSYETVGNFVSSPQNNPGVENKLVKSEKSNLKTDKTKNLRQVPKKYIDDIKNYLTDPSRKRVHPSEEYGPDVKHIKYETSRRLSPSRYSPSDSSRHRSPTHYRHLSPNQRSFESDHRKIYAPYSRGSGTRPQSPSPRRRSRERKSESHRYKSPERRSRSPGFYRSRRSRSPGYRSRDKYDISKKTGSKSRRTPEHFLKKRKKSRSRSRDSFCSLSFDSESSSSSSSSSSDSSNESSDEKKKKSKKLSKKSAAKDKRKNEDKKETSLKDLGASVKTSNDNLLTDVPKNSGSFSQGESKVTDAKNEMPNSFNFDKDKLNDFLELVKNTSMMNNMMENIRQKSLIMDQPSMFPPATITGDINTVQNTHISVPQPYSYPTMAYESTPAYIPTQVENFHPVISPAVFPVSLPPDTYGPHPAAITQIVTRPMKKPLQHRNSALTTVTISDTLCTPSIVNTNVPLSSSTERPVRPSQPESVNLHKVTKSASDESLKSTRGSSFDKKPKENSKPVVGSTSEKNKVAIMEKYKRMKVDRQIAHCKVNSAVEDMVDMRKQLDEAFGKKVNASEKFIHSKCKNLLNVANDSVTNFLKDARRIDDELGRFKAKLPTALQTELSNIKFESKDYEDGSNDPDEVYSCFDSGDHMCYQCNAQFKSASDMMKHIRTLAHMEKCASDNSWTSYFKKESKPVDDKKKTVLQAIKGIEFMKPLSGFFCSLCKEVVLDIASAEQHLKGHDHFVKYRTFAKKNPLYERKCLFKRYIQISISAKQKRMKESEEKKQRLVEHKKNKEAAEKRSKEIIESQRKMEKKFEELEEDSNVIPTTNNQKATDIKLNLSEKDRESAKENDRQNEKEKTNERERSKLIEKQKSREDEKEKIKLSEKSKSSKEAETKNSPKYIYIGKAPNYKKNQVQKSVKEVPWYKREAYLNKKEELNIGDIPLPNIVDATISDKNLQPDIKSSNHDSKESTKSVSEYSKNPLVTLSAGQYPYPSNNPSVASLSKVMPSNASSQKSSNNPSKTVPMEIDNSQDPKTKPKLATEEEKDFFILGITKEDFKPLVIPVPPPSSVISYPVSSSTQNFLPTNTACNTAFTANTTQNVAQIDFSVPPPSIVPYQNNRSNVPMYGNANCTQSAGQYPYSSNNPSVPLYSNQLSTPCFSNPPPVSPFRNPPPMIPYSSQQVSQFSNVSNVPPNTRFLNTTNLCPSTAPFSNVSNLSSNVPFSNARNVLTVPTVQNNPPPPVSNKTFSTAVQSNMQSCVPPEAASDYSSNNIVLSASNSKVTPTAISTHQSKSTSPNFKNKGNLIAIVPKTILVTVQKPVTNTDSKTVKAISKINTIESSITKSNFNKVGNNQTVDKKNNENTEKNVLSEAKSIEKKFKAIVPEIDSKTPKIIPKVVEVTEHSESNFNSNKNEQEQNIKDSTKFPTQESSEVGNKENADKDNKNAENVLSVTEGAEKNLKAIVPEIDSKTPNIIPKVVEVTEHSESNFNSNKNEQEQNIKDSTKFPTQESSEVGNKENADKDNKNAENVLSVTEGAEKNLKAIVPEIDSKTPNIIPKVEVTEHSDSTFNSNKIELKQIIKDNTPIEESGRVGIRQNADEDNKNVDNVLSEIESTNKNLKAIVPEIDSKPLKIIQKVEVTEQSESASSSNENELKQNIKDSIKLPMEESARVSNKQNVDEDNKNPENVLSGTESAEKALKAIVPEIDSKTPKIIPKVVEVTEHSESFFSGNTGELKQSMKDGMPIEKSGIVDNKQNADEDNENADNVLRGTEDADTNLKSIVSETPKIVPKVVEITEHENTFSSNKNELKQNIKDNLPVEESGEVDNKQNVDKNNKNIFIETENAEKNLKATVPEIDSETPMTTQRIVEVTELSENTFSNNEIELKQNIRDSIKLPTEENSDSKKYDFDDQNNTELCQTVDTISASLNDPVNPLPDQVKYNNNVLFLMNETSKDSVENENKSIDSSNTNTENCEKQIDGIFTTNKVFEKLTDNSYEVFKMPGHSGCETIVSTQKNERLESPLNDCQAGNQNSNECLDAMESTIEYESPALQNTNINHNENLSSFQKASTYNANSSKEFSENAEKLNLGTPEEKMDNLKNFENGINIQSMEIEDNKIIERSSVDNCHDLSNSKESCKVSEHLVCEVSVTAAKNQIAIEKDTDISPFKVNAADSSVHEVVMAEDSTTDNRSVHNDSNFAHFNIKLGNFENEKFSTFEKSEMCDMDIDKIESVEHSKIGDLSADECLNICENQNEGSSNFNEAKIYDMDVDQEIFKIQNTKGSNPEDLSTKCDSLKIGENQSDSQNVGTGDNICIEKSLDNFYSADNSNKNFETSGKEHSDAFFSSANTRMENEESIKGSACENNPGDLLQNQSTGNIVEVKESTCDTAFQNIESDDVQNEKISYKTAKVCTVDIDQVMSETNKVEKLTPGDSSFKADEQEQRNSATTSVSVEKSGLNQPLSSNLHSNLDKTTAFIRNDQIKLMSTSVLPSENQSSNCSDSSLGEIPVSDHGISNQTFCEPMDLDESLFSDECCLKVNLVPEESKGEFTNCMQNQNSVTEIFNGTHNSTNDCQEKPVNLQKDFASEDTQKNSESQLLISVTTNLNSADIEATNTLSEKQFFENPNVHVYENNPTPAESMQVQAPSEPEKNACEQEKRTVKEEKIFEDNLLLSVTDVFSPMEVKEDVPIPETEYQGNEAVIKESAAKTLNLSASDDSAISLDKKTETFSLPIDNEEKTLENTDEKSKSSNESEMREAFETSGLPPIDAEATDTSKASDLLHEAGTKNESDTDEYEENDEI